jgi:hypothetical protein
MVEPPTVENTNLVCPITSSGFIVYFHVRRAGAR